MKKVYAAFLSIFLSLFAVSNVFAQLPTSAPIINYFNSEIAVQKDASLIVKETINVTTDGNIIKRGIYREFPLVYHLASGKNVRVGFKILNASLNGGFVQYHKAYLSNGIRIYFGDKKVFLPVGTYTYTLEYRVTGELGFFADHDELYWNVTGNDWQFPIANAKAIVILPEDAAATITDFTAYTGGFGSRDQNYSAVKTPENNIVFEITKPLAAKEGFTIVVGWKKGFIIQPTFAAEILHGDSVYTSDFLLGSALVILLFYYLIAWYLYGRDPKQDVVIPQYEPPKGFTPAALRYVLDMGYDDKVFAAAILNMAVKGFLAIKETAGKIFTLVKQGNFVGTLLPSEKVIADNLFVYGSVVELRQQEYIAKTVEKFKKELKNEFDKIYFVKNQQYVIFGIIFTIIVFAITVFQDPRLFPVVFFLGFFSVFLLVVFRNSLSLNFIKANFASKSFAKILRLIYSFIILVVMFYIFFYQIVLVNFSDYWLYFAFILLFLLINGLFLHLMKRPTFLGAQLINHIKGFKLFLEVAEKDRINFRNPPQFTPELFEKYLPYALALNVEQQWCEQFSVILAKANYQPTWYTGVYYGNFNTRSFSDSLSASFASAISASATAPGSSSGFGGGSSGGGGGGGGGGGW